MDKAKTKRKQIHPKILDAQYDLDHAIVRGELPETVHELRTALENVKAQYGDK